MMIPEKFKLSDEQIRVLKSCSVYWTEISDREPNWRNRCATDELQKIVFENMINPIQVLLILGDYVNNQYPKKAVIKDGWQFAGRTLSIMGAPIKIEGQLFSPIKWDNELDPDLDEDLDWQKTASLNIVQ